MTGTQAPQIHQSPPPPFTHPHPGLAHPFVIESNSMSADPETQLKPKKVFLLTDVLFLKKYPELYFPSNHFHVHGNI